MSVSDAKARKSLAHAVDGSGPPLILLHGLSGSGRWWSRNLDAFAAHFRTYTVDLPGFGDNRAVRWSRLDDTAGWLTAWMDDEGLERANIAGHSLGGAVAARLASRRPDRIERLVLVDAAIRPHGMRAVARMVDVVKTISQHSPGFAPLYLRDLLRSHPWSATVATFDALLAEWEPHLSQITAPTLIVWGEHDPITPIALGHGIAATISVARLVTMPRAGHNPMWECAEAFNDEVLQFLGTGPSNLSPTSEAAASFVRTSPDHGRVAP
jgi:pimeloyl-ACP methyl ester carboxylesterase